MSNLLHFLSGSKRLPQEKHLRADAEPNSEPKRSSFLGFLISSVKSSSSSGKVKDGTGLPPMRRGTSARSDGSFGDGNLGRGFYPCKMLRLSPDSVSLSFDGGSCLSESVLVPFNLGEVLEKLSAPVFIKLCCFGVLF